MGIEKSADDVFDTWQRTEPLFKQFDYRSIEPNSSWKTEIKKQDHKLLERLFPYPASFQQVKKLGNNDFKSLRTLLECLHKNDIPAFIDHLKKIRFSTLAAKKEDEKASVNIIIRKYNGIMRILCGSANRSLQNKFLYALSNDFFDFCFNPKTSKQFKEIISQPKYHALAHLMYANMWVNLGSKGWSTWYENSIKQLQKYAQNGKEIVYIAGGTDIIKLLKHEIYTIRIIDPFLPTQKTYYSDGWRFLVGGRASDSLGDTITFSFNKTTLILRRVKYKKTGTLRATLSNGTRRTLPKSSTTWNIFKENSKKPVGKLTIERRFAQQDDTHDDFSYDENKTTLISFNELHFITTTGETSWGIDIQKFHPRFILHVKQLKQPLTKSWLRAVRQADRSPLEFIQLGNCID